MPNRAQRFHIEIALRAAAAVGMRAARRRLSRTGRTQNIFLCIVDHYEPNVGEPAPETARARVMDWMERYPKMAAQHRDADGRPPAHTFFYPWDEYDAWECERLRELCAAGYGEVELHLHHRDDTSETLRRTLREALEVYRNHGFLSRWPDGKTAFGFVHGNWALDNSRIEGTRNYCGVNDEISLLAEMGCYADFTFPAWPQTAQPRQTNSLHYATDDPTRPKSYDTGPCARVGGGAKGDLLLAQGPLVPYLQRRGRGWRVAIDDSDLASYRRYAPERLDRWIRAGIHVLGRPDCLFIKLHCHGAADKNCEALLGEDLHALFSDAEARYNDGQRYRLRYVTARELFNIVRAIEAGVDSNWNAARDYLLLPPGAEVSASPKPVLAS